MGAVERHRRRAHEPPGNERTSARTASVSGGSRDPRTITALASFAFSAHAAGPLGRDGTPIRTSSYTVDLTQTPVLASARVTGLAGAYVAIAEGIDGNTQTPVAPAVRTNYSLDHFDYELGLGLTLPATLTSTDFFNTGRGRTQLSDAKQQGFVFITPALNLVWGNFGIGATLEISNYTLRRSNDVPGNGRWHRCAAVGALFLVGHLQAAESFANGQITAGAGLRVIGLDLTDPLAPALDTDLFTTAGAGLELGALYTPSNEPYRIGAAFRSPVLHATQRREPHPRQHRDRPGHRKFDRSGQRVLDPRQDRAALGSQRRTRGSVRPAPPQSEMDRSGGPQRRGSASEPP